MSAGEFESLGPFRIWSIVFAISSTLSPSGPTVLRMSTMCVSSTNRRYAMSADYSMNIRQCTVLPGHETNGGRTYCGEGIDEREPRFMYSGGDLPARRHDPVRRGENGRVEAECFGLLCVGVRRNARIVWLLQGWEVR